MKAETQLLVGRVAIRIIGAILLISVILVARAALGSTAAEEDASFHGPTVLEGAMGVINVLLALFFGALKTKIAEIEKTVVMEKTCNLKMAAVANSVAAIKEESKTTSAHVEEIKRDISKMCVSLAVLAADKEAGR